MNQICLVCQRQATEKGLFCQDQLCPAETSPILLQFGDWVEDIEIVRPVAILPSAIVYEARRQRERLFIKIAHQDSDRVHIERLKRESEFLQRIAQEKHPPLVSLPVWTPPFVGLATTPSPSTPSTKLTYGRAVVGERLIYYYVFQYHEGETLRAVLLKRPQLWISHIGWIMQIVAASVAYIQSKEYIHAALAPEGVLVSFDEHGQVTAMLLDIGVLLPPKDVKGAMKKGVALAYRDPEWFQQEPKLTFKTDVYLLGLICYEMLNGAPAISSQSQDEPTIERLIRGRHFVPFRRKQDVNEDVINLVCTAVGAIESRQKNALEFFQRLQVAFGQPPTLRTSSWITTQRLLQVVIVLLVLAFFTALASSFGLFFATGA